jgi:hypothetical protein
VLLGFSQPRELAIDVVEERIYVFGRPVPSIRADLE